MLGYRCGLRYEHGGPQCIATTWPGRHGPYNSDTVAGYELRGKAALTTSFLRLQIRSRSMRIGGRTAIVRGNVNVS